MFIRPLFIVLVATVGCVAPVSDPNPKGDTLEGDEGPKPSPEGESDDRYPSAECQKDCATRTAQCGFPTEISGSACAEACGTITVSQHDCLMKSSCAQLTSLANGAEVCGLVLQTLQGGGGGGGGGTTGGGGGGTSGSGGGGGGTSGSGGGGTCMSVGDACDPYASPSCPSFICTCDGMSNGIGYSSCGGWENGGSASCQGGHAVCTKYGPCKPGQTVSYKKDGCFPS